MESETSSNIQVSSTSLAEVTQEVTQEVLQEVVPGSTHEVTPEVVTQEVTQEATPEVVTPVVVTPEVDQEVVQAITDIIMQAIIDEKQEGTCIELNPIISSSNTAIRMPDYPRTVKLSASGARNVFEGLTATFSVFNGFLTMELSPSESLSTPTPCTSIDNIRFGSIPECYRPTVEKKYSTMIISNNMYVPGSLTIGTDGIIKINVSNCYDFQVNHYSALPHNICITYALGKSLLGVL